MDQPIYKKPSKAVCRKALEEVVPELIQDQNYNDTTADFLMNKITQAVAQKFKGRQIVKNVFLEGYREFFLRNCFLDLLK